MMLSQAPTIRPRELSRPTVPCEPPLELRSPLMTRVLEFLDEVEDPSQELYEAIVNLLK